MGLNSTHFVDTLVQCSLRQILENGFFHADPHAGNTLYNSYMEDTLDPHMLLLSQF